MNQKGKGNDLFRTPKYIFDQLNAIYNFEYDAACTEEDCLCHLGSFFDMGEDALLQSWGKLRTFCNPPFSKKAEFIKKAYEEVINDHCPICVMILPLNCMDTKAWHKYIEGKHHYEILQGRISFIDPETKQPKKGNNSGTVIVYFKKKIKV